MPATASAPGITPRLVEEVLEVWDLGGARVARIAHGNVNWTGVVDLTGERRVLQRLNPIFRPEIHHNIEAVTRHLAAAGLTTSRIVPTRDGALWHEAGGGAWRLLTYIEGEVFERAPSAASCRSAGGLLGRFHRALASLAHDFVAPRLGVHDTQGQVALLTAACQRLPHQPAAARVAALRPRIARGLGQLVPMATGRRWTAHGDAKVANMVFAPDGEARALIDLDTVGPMAVAHELGDAWRSFCAGGHESTAELTFLPAHLEAAWSGWCAAGPPPLLAEERACLADALPTIALELCARFARDALEERFFAWNHERFEHAWEHHLLRAEGQLSLAESYLAQHAEARRILAQ